MDKIIKVGKEEVLVSQEIYREYYKMKRRERYLERDIKVGRMKVDLDRQKVVYYDSKEVSMSWFMELGRDFADAQAVEDIVCYKAMLLILREALKELDRKELEFIEAIYFKNLSARELSRNEKVSHVTVLKKRNKILDKLKKHFM
jgi:DNA-directed RNA polymerase specialized sigma subunit